MKAQEFIKKHFINFKTIAKAAIRTAHQQVLDEVNFDAENTYSPVMFSGKLMVKKTYAELFIRYQCC